jgi:hypothetical protein
MISGLPVSLLPPTDRDLKRLSYDAALRWALGPDGRLRGSRLRRLAQARNYAPGWARVHRNQTLEEALQQNREWRDQIVRKKRAMRERAMRS